jgi:hypothetical protein
MNYTENFVPKHLERLRKTGTSVRILSTMFEIRTCYIPNEVLLRFLPGVLRQPYFGTPHSEATFQKYILCREISVSLWLSASRGE